MEKLAIIAEILKNSNMKTLFVLSSQIPFGKSIRETYPIELDQEFNESSKSPKEDTKHDITLPKDSSMVIPLS